MRIVVTLALLCLLAPRPAAALEPDKAFHHYVRGAWSIQQGLPQISAISLAQDRLGYVWVGTQAGLARFDGVRFTSFTPENEPALPGIFIRSLLVASDGRLLVGTYKGLAVYDGRRFEAIAAVDPARWPALDVTALAEDERGTVWVATTAGTFRLDRGRLQPVAGSPGLAQALLPRTDGLWVGSRGAVHRRLATGHWETLPLPPTARDALVHRMAAAQGRIWAATSVGLFRLEAQGWTGYTAVPALVDAPVELLYQDSDGNLWAGGDAGVARIRGGAPVEFVPARAAGGIPGLRVALEDREGNLWLGSQWEGLIRLTDSWTRRYSTAEGLNDRIVWSVAPDPDGRRLWVGGNDGLSVLEDGRIRLVVPGSALPHPNAYNLLAERDRLWIGTRGGLRVLEAGESRPRALPELAGIGGSQINAILREPGGDLLIGTPDGLFRLRGTELRRYGAEDGLTDHRVRTLYIDDDGGLLVGTQDGLFARRGTRFVRNTDPGMPAAVDVTAIRRLAGGQLVVGTLAERTYVSAGGRWHPLGPEQGLPSNAPFFITEHDGHVWLAGIRGIARMPVAQLDAVLAGRAPTVGGEMLLNERGDAMAGQQGFCCNGAGSAKGALVGSTLWLPTRDGVVAMDTRGIRKNAVVPGVAVERMQVGRDWLASWQVAGSDLADGARDVSFDYTVLSLQDPKSVRVQYRLRGYDRDWVDGDSFNRHARYTNLPPGDYVFEARGTNNAGVWGVAPAALRFSVPPRFHETGWFVALCVAALALLVHAGYRLQRHRYHLRQAELQSLVEQRTEALALANRQLEEASHTDPLTGLRNRRYIGAQLPADLSFYDRQASTEGGDDKAMLFALVDIDHFKQVNDRYGHRAGDLVLQQFADVLARLVRTGDYVARWGGEEFLLVFRPMPQRSLAIIGERIRSAVVAHPFDLGNGMVLPLTCSVGLSQYPLVSADDGARLGWESMIELADQALYHVKTHGRDGWAAFRPTADTDLDRLLEEMHRDLPGMLDRGELEVTGEIAGRPVTRRPVDLA